MTHGSFAQRGYPRAIRCRAHGSRQSAGRVLGKDVRRVSAEPATQTGEAFCPFDSDTDYKQMDGKLWYEGVRSFWASARKARQHSRSTMTGQRNQ